MHDSSIIELLWTSCGDPEMVAFIPVDDAPIKVRTWISQVTPLQTPLRPSILSSSFLGGIDSSSSCSSCSSSSASSCSASCCCCSSCCCCCASCCCCSSCSASCSASCSSSSCSSSPPSFQLISRSLLLGNAAGVHLHDIMLEFVRSRLHPEEMRAQQHRVVSGILRRCKELGVKFTGSTGAAHAGEHFDWVCGLRPVMYSLSFLF
jgi:hypothetical protein